MTDIENIISHIGILRTWAAVNPKYNIGLNVDECHKAVEWLDDAMVLLKALWNDLSEVRSCKNCKNVSKCDPKDNGWKQRFWQSCGGSCKLKWEWRGVQNDFEKGK